MIIEGAPWAKLETLAPDLHDPYWRITLDFLKIAFAHWPEWLAERGLIDRAKRIALLIEDEIKALEGARRGPTIIAGSTGANRATARLIAAIARAPNGAVVLPDLDLNLDDRTWAMIGGKDDGSQGLAGHPQALLHRLIGEIGVARADVAPLGSLVAALAARSAFLSEALRPAESTDLWRERGWTLSPLALAAALQGVAILVADNENEEALALAIAMRETLETPGKTAALVTPDPSIARRVSAELARWGVEVEDSAGRTLGQSPAGVLARLILEAAIEFTPRSFLALLAHPSARFGRSLEPSRSRDAGAWSSPSFALSRLRPSMISNGRSPRRAKPPNDRHAHPRSAASARPAGGRRRRSRAMSQARSLPCAPLGPRLPCAIASLSIGRRFAADSGGSAEPEGGRARVRAIDAAHGRMERGGGRELPHCAQRIRRFVRRCAGRGARSAGERRTSAPADSRPPRSASPELRLRASGGPRRNRLAARGRDRRLSQPADARRARPFGAGAAHRPDGARFRRRARRARGDLEPREEARRPADRRLPLSAADGGCGWPRGDEGAGRARRALSRLRARARSAERVPAAAKTGAAPSGRTSPKSAQRHSHRDFAARSLRDLSPNTFSD